MIQKRRLSYLFIVLMLASCTGRVNTNPPQSSDALRNVAVQVARLSDAAAAAVKTSIALAQDGLITPQQEREALLVIKRANDGAGVLTARLRGISALDANTKLSLLGVVDEISLALRDQKTLALFGVSNPKSQERLRGVLDVIATVVGLLKNLLGGQ